MEDIGQEEKTNLLNVAKLKDFQKKQKSEFSENKGFTKTFYDVDETQFVEKKLRNLEYLWRFQISKPWHIPVEAIRNYYGEKIGLYFEFLGYYTKHLLVISFLGITAWIIQTQYHNNSKEYVYTGMIFGCNIYNDNKNNN